MEQTSAQTKGVNWDPLSEVRRAGELNLETQEVIKALAQASAGMVERGTASGHLEVLLIMVKK